jgi:hypothetical protein
MVHLANAVASMSQACKISLSSSVRDAVTISPFIWKTDPMLDDDAIV